jgi:hypothetical protein
MDILHLVILVILGTYTILLCYLCPQFTVWVEFFDVFVLLTCHGSDRGKYHFAMESQVLDLPGSAWDDCLCGDPGARSGTSGHRGTGSGILVNIPLRQQNRTTSAIGNQLLHHFRTSSLIHFVTYFRIFEMLGC